MWLNRMSSFSNCWQRWQIGAWTSSMRRTSLTQHGPLLRSGCGTRRSCARLREQLRSGACAAARMWAWSMAVRSFEPGAFLGPVRLDPRLAPVFPQSLKRSFVLATHPDHPPARRPPRREVVRPAVYHEIGPKRESFCTIEHYHRALPSSTFLFLNTVPGFQKNSKGFTGGNYAGQLVIRDLPRSLVVKYRGLQNS